ncbi:restriction endonuclease subunit S [Hymenobacter aerophilus]|uniref:restriction endonuclease subunit S n=1 Tax=Hymenobacter aerophilus TaxID=119644 RepID=UPI00146E62B6|nr:restriction endonuclease subunit S [Hymenobacter aerophilus]
MSASSQLPEGWASVTLGEITKNISIKNTDKKVEQVVSVTKHRGIVNSLDFFKKQVFSKELSTYKVIKREQFAYATIHLDEGSIGFLAEHDVAVLSPMYTVFEAKKTKVDTGFLFTVLKSDRLLNIYNNVGLGSINRRKSIPYSVFAKIEIPLPSLPEQQQIAEILSTVDEKLAVMDEQLAQTQELKKGLMERLMTKGIGHSVFHDSPIGRTPSSWSIVSIGKVMELINGKAFKPSEWENEGLPIIRIQNLNKLDAPFNYYSGIIESKYLVSKNDLLFAWSGTKGVSFGARVWKGDKAVLNQHIFRVVPDSEKLDSAFAYIILKQAQAEIETKAHGFKSSFVHVKKSDITKMTIALPPLPEQRQIAEILTTVDDKLQVLTDKKAQYQELKRGLMQQLLTGQRRVRVAEPVMA